MIARIPDMSWLWRIPRDTHLGGGYVCREDTGCASLRKVLSGERVLVLSGKCRRDK